MLLIIKSRGHCIRIEADLAWGGAHGLSLPVCQAGLGGALGEVIDLLGDGDFADLGLSFGSCVGGRKSFAENG